jgi:hypothetical protein
MRRIVLNAKALKWGNSYGFRITKADFERAGLRVGEEVILTIGGDPGKVDLSHLRTFSGRDRFPGWSHDDVLYLAQLEKLRRSGNISEAEFQREKRALEAKHVDR